MARRKIKLTPFARFLIFLLFAAPLAYLVASYYNGQDGVQNIKEALGLGDRTEAAAPQVETQEEETAVLDCDELQDRFDSLQAKYEALQEDNLRLMERLQSMKEVEADGSADEPVAPQEQ